MPFINVKSLLPPPQKKISLEYLFLYQVKPCLFLYLDKLYIYIYLATEYLTNFFPYYVTSVYSSLVLNMC